MISSATSSLDPNPCCGVQVRESAGAEVRERVYVTAAEEHELSGSKGTANFVMKVSGNQAPAVAAADHSSAQNCGMLGMQPG